MTDKILILVHNKSNRELLTQWLSGRYSTTTIETGEMEDDGIDVAFDLCILDGHNLCFHMDHLRARKAAEKTILPILLITARSQVSLLTKQLWQTVDDVITAPVQIGKLHARVEVLLRSRRLSKEILQQKEAELIAELQRAKAELEVRVQERTKELERTYAELEQETRGRVSALEDLRKNEQLLLQQSRLAAMGEMLGNIAHQWRQPLNNLGLLLQQLPVEYELGQVDARLLEETVEKAMTLINHLSRTIDDFSNFLQPEKEKAAFDVKEAVTSTLSLLEATLKASEIDLQLMESEQLVVEGYRNEFCQVIINLITNARDAFKERAIPTPKLVIGLAREDEAAVITITDNAGGIAEEIIGKVFDPYFTTKGPKGTGIGLFMSRNIIESMNGSLTVRNTAEGTEFTIVI